MSCLYPGVYGDTYDSNSKVPVRLLSSQHTLKLKNHTHLASNHRLFPDIIWSFDCVDYRLVIWIVQGILIQRMVVYDGVLWLGET